MRHSLRTAHSDAFAEKRLPRHDEITNTAVPYLDAVVEETLRLAHTVPLQERQCTQDTLVLGHYIPKGTNVFLPNKGPSFTEPGFEIPENSRHESSQKSAKEHGVHRWAEADMNIFLPSRWLTRNEPTGAEVFDLGAGPNLPFGLGLRGCFGRKLAYLELKLLMTLLVWTFDFLCCPEEFSGYDEIESLTRKPAHCYVRLERTSSLL